MMEVPTHSETSRPTLFPLTRHASPSWAMRSAHGTATLRLSGPDAPNSRLLMVIDE